jgi:hypothetical protein
MGRSLWNTFPAVKEKFSANERLKIYASSSVRTSGAESSGDPGDPGGKRERGQEHSGAYPGDLSEME